MWFEQLTGFEEQSPENVRKKLSVQGETLISLVDGQKWTCGHLELPTLQALKSRAPLLSSFKDKIQVREVVANVQDLHVNPENKGALFQAASQFNLLEMVGPHITPEQGIDKYDRDYTQGPACAIACGAGTIFRSYFVKVGEQVGQTAKAQIDCLEDIGDALNNKELQLWEMQNGYAMVNQEGIVTINKLLSGMSDEQRETLKGKLKVGIQWNTEVTISHDKQLVSQIYCSALPVAYSPLESFYWEGFASVILEATYEATFYAALINASENGSNKVFLTLVGGGAFGNDECWILDALERTISLFTHTPLDVYIVSYGRSNPLINKMSKKINNHIQS